MRTIELPNQEKRGTTMTTIELHELQEKATEIIHQARDNGEPVEVTEHGTVLAFLVPVYSEHSGEDGEAEMDLETLVAEISKYLPERVDAVEVIRDIRREI